MKKTFKLWMLAALMMSSSAIGAWAQESKHEIGIAIGAGSNSTILGTLEDLVEITSTAGSIKYDKEKNFGPLSLEYFYRVSPKIGVGGVFAYVNSKKDVFAGGNKVGDAKVNFMTVMPAVKLSWFEHAHTAMYSKLAAGVTFRSEKQKWADVSESNVKFNWQASLIGIELGSKFRVFGELGVGEQGIALVGVRYRF